MGITKSELNDIIKPTSSIEKFGTISSDGQKLTIRIPKDIENELNIKKGQILKWLLKEGSDEIILKIKDGS